jgi:hypothetical protein
MSIKFYKYLQIALVLNTFYTDWLTYRLRKNEKYLITT